MLISTGEGVVVVTCKVIRPSSSVVIEGARGVELLQPV